ncbi:MAG: glycosyltransferase [Nitrospiraceae bacterium]|nr:glycosyltransferase [Nitrospiraceae bacterium]
MTDPHLSGGGQVRYLANLARELTALGHSVTIGCRPGSVLRDRAREAGCECLDRFFFRGGLRPRSWTHDIAEARRFIAAESPDILHVSGSQDHWTLALANRLAGRPVCVVRTRHNTYKVKDNLPNRVLNLRWTDYQIVVCNVVRETLQRQPTFDGSRMCSIHNGVDAETFYPDPAARAKARTEFGYADGDLVCGIAARLVKAKGHAFLFKAAALLRETLPQLRILVLGQGGMEAGLRGLADECGIVGIVHFAGFRDDMAHCTQAFDIGIQPSIDCDTSSFSMKEQMAAEKPVIASDYGGLVEIITDGAEGLVVPTGTVEPLAEAIRKLASDAPLRTRMGQAGRERILREFTVQVFASRTVEAYRRAIEVHHERVAH